MSKNFKNGFSYYMAETDRFQDIKVKRLKKRWACEGYAVYQYALNEIYRVEGCYIRFTDDQLFDCADYWNISEERVREIIDYCAEIGLFNAQAWKDRGILTARSIQVRYLDMSKRAKKKTYIPAELCLVEPEVTQTSPEALPLFPEQASAAAPDMTPEPSRTFANTSELSGNFPETRDTEKQSKENSPSIPPEDLKEEAQRIIRSLQENTESSPMTVIISEPKRNTPGLLGQLSRYNLTPKETEEVLQLSGYGQIGNPVWSILNDITTSQGIKQPRLFLLARLRAATENVHSRNEQSVPQSRTAYPNTARAKSGRN